MERVKEGWEGGQVLGEKVSWLNEIGLMNLIVAMFCCRHAVIIPLADEEWALGLRLVLAMARLEIDNIRQGGIRKARETEEN